MSYVPRRGDIVWLTFQPQAGHEQGGRRRPALVVSPEAYNCKVGLALLCPVTKQVKGYPFEVALPSGVDVEGVFLVDQIKSLDWQARKAEFSVSVPSAIMTEVVGKLRTLIESDV